MAAAERLNGGQQAPDGAQQAPDGAQRRPVPLPDWIVILTPGTLIFHPFLTGTLFFVSLHFALRTTFVRWG
jgi:hypothetical protein